MPHSNVLDTRRVLKVASTHYLHHSREPIQGSLSVDRIICMNAMVDVAVQQRHGHAVELLAHPSQTTEALFTRLREKEKKSQ